MKIAAFLYALQACLAQYPSAQTTFVDLFDCSHTKGNICYFSTQYEKWRPDASQFPKAALGKPIGDWPGEFWVDYRNIQVRQLLAKRMDLARAKGCLGLDLDNVDGHLNSTGFPLKVADQVAFVKWYSAEAHKRGLLVGLKNSPETAKSLSSLVDYHVSEECTKYKECGSYPAGKTFFIEYTPVNAAVCKVRPFTLFANVNLTQFKRCP